MNDVLVSAFILPLTQKVKEPKTGPERRRNGVSRTMRLG